MPDPSASPSIEIIRRLRADEPELRRLGVERLALFGSHARGSATPASDVDLMMEPVAGRPFSLWSLGEVRAHVRGLVGREVDLVIAGDLQPEWRARIASDAIQVL